MQAATYTPPCSSRATIAEPWLTISPSLAGRRHQTGWPLRPPSLAPTMSSTSLAFRLFRTHLFDCVILVYAFPSATSTAPHPTASQDPRAACLAALPDCPQRSLCRWHLLRASHPPGASACRSPGRPACPRGAARPACTAP
eukprot:5624467-Pleurochrysis_carterae.AAC.1